jgi:hypothetical protein
LHGGLSLPLSLGLPVDRLFDPLLGGGSYPGTLSWADRFPVSLYITGALLVAIAVPFGRINEINGLPVSPKRR